MKTKRWYDVRTDEMVEVPPILANRADKALHEWFKSTGQRDWSTVNKAMGDQALHEAARREATILCNWINAHPRAA